jgi:hypothetical protein
MRKGSAFVRPVKVSVRIGKPIPTAGLTLEARDQLIERVRGAVQGLLEQGSLWEPDKSQTPNPKEPDSLEPDDTPQAVIRRRCE